MFKHMTYGGFLNPPVIIHFNEIFPYKPTSYWGYPMAMEPHIYNFAASNRGWLVVRSQTPSQMVFRELAFVGQQVNPETYLNMHGKQKSFLNGFTL